ncbi:MAG: hypothetical protein U1E17_06100 [Geminicoccaceae bacterium]
MARVAGDLREEEAVERIFDDYAGIRGCRPTAYNDHVSSISAGRA